MGIFMMIAGQFYMAMPLTAAATTFYQVHSVYEEDNEQIKANEDAAKNGGNIENDTANNNNDTTTTATATETTATIQPVLDTRLQMSIRHIIRHIRSFEYSLHEILQLLHAAPPMVYDENRMLEEKQHSKGQQKYHKNHATTTTTTNPLTILITIKKKIATLCKDLEDCLHGSERDLVDMLYRYHQLLKGQQNNNNNNHNNNKSSSSTTSGNDKKNSKGQIAMIQS
jgi:hypothetical protein